MLHLQHEAVHSLLPELGASLAVQQSQQGLDQGFDAWGRAAITLGAPFAQHAVGVLGVLSQHLRGSYHRSIETMRKLLGYTHGALNCRNPDFVQAKISLTTGMLCILGFPAFPALVTDPVRARMDIYEVSAQARKSDNSNTETLQIAVVTSSTKIGIRGGVRKNPPAACSWLCWWAPGRLPGLRLPGSARGCCRQHAQS